jgi:hypothetical protein
MSQAFEAARGPAILPNLLLYQGLEISKYVFALDALHLKQTFGLHNVGS